VPGSLGDQRLPGAESAPSDCGVPTAASPVLVTLDVGRCACLGPSPVAAPATHVVPPMTATVAAPANARTAARRAVRTAGEELALSSTS
jgi:hypothetical protein